MGALGPRRSWSRPWRLGASDFLSRRDSFPRSIATIRALSAGGGPVRRLTNQVTPKLISIPRVPMPSGLIPNHQASGPLHSKTLNQPM